MIFYSACELAADFINLDRKELGLKPPKELVSKSADGFIFGKHRWRYLRKDENTDGHILVIGGAGSGKSSCIAIPTIRAWRQRVFAIDIKGELTAKTKYSRPMLKVFNPLDPDSYGFDPFFLLSRSHNLVEDVREIVFAIIARPPDIKDPFWIEGARNILTGAMLHYYHLGYSFSEIMGLVQARPVMDLVMEVGESETQVARLFVNQFSGMDIKTLTGIYAELSNHIMVFATDPAIKGCLTREKNITPYDLERGFDIFLQIPEDRLEQWRPLTTTIVNQFIKHFERRPDGQAAPILFYLAEFPRLGKVEAVNGLATLRSKKIIFCLEIQSLAQLDALYGLAQRKVITDNCSYKAILNAADQETQEYFSRLVGTYDRARISKGQSFDGGDTDILRASSLNESTEAARIIKPEEFATLKDIVLLTPHGFCWAKKNPYYLN